MTATDQMHRGPTGEDAPLGGVLVRAAIVVFAVEVLIMVVFNIVRPDAHTWNEALLDASLLTLVSSAILYGWIVRPLDVRLKNSMKELRSAKARAEQLSRRDFLTGTLNRRTFFEHFEREWERTRRNGAPLSCIMVDIDFFKEINDTYGHLAGDAALKTVAELLEANCRANDVVCRYGGEEFCLVLPETGRNQAARCAQRMRAEIEACPMNFGGHAFHVTASFGVAQYHEQMRHVDELVNLADQALLTAKRAGRNRVEYQQELMACV